MTGEFIENGVEVLDSAPVVIDEIYEAENDDVAVADMDEKLKIALEETGFLDGMVIEGNNRKVAQFLSLREHLLDSIEYCNQLEQDAKRWRALMSSQRIRIIGSAGLGSPEYQHVGLEI